MTLQPSSVSYPQGIRRARARSAHRRSTAFLAVALCGLGAIALVAHSPALAGKFNHERRQLFANLATPFKRAAATCHAEAAAGSTSTNPLRSQRGITRRGVLGLTLVGATALLTGYTVVNALYKHNPTSTPVRRLETLFGWKGPNARADAALRALAKAKGGGFTFERQHEDVWRVSRNGQQFGSLILEGLKPRDLGRLGWDIVDVKFASSSELTSRERKQIRSELKQTFSQDRRLSLPELGPEYGVDTILGKAPGSWGLRIAKTD